MVGKAILALAAVIAALVAALASNVSAASATITCPQGVINDNYSFYTSNHTPAVGGYLSAGIKPVTLAWGDPNNPFDSMAGSEDVSNAAYTKFVRVGIEQSQTTAQQIRIFMEEYGATNTPAGWFYDSTFGAWRQDVATANIGSTYTVSINHTGTNSWSITAGGVTSPVLNFTTALTGVSYDNDVTPQSSACPTSNWIFSSPHPWAFSNVWFGRFSTWGGSIDPWHSYLYSGLWEIDYPYVDCYHEVPMCSSPGA